GGRGPAERVSFTPLGDEPVPRAAPDGPWPGRLPEPAPTVLADDPVELLDAVGNPVRVTGRGLFSAEPAQVAGRYHGELRWWAGPWPVDEWWWDRQQEAAGRAARAQVVIESPSTSGISADAGLGLLLCYRQRQWHVEGVYE
ncbi:MAG TPA: DNA polymerase Y family protein, partial [Mycobacterium sp.]|nr:DNA polymerase Y family protein [Mycobacterium sp.]